MLPYTNLSLFLIIGSKNYISDPKILTKSAATVVFCQGSCFKKDTYIISTQTFAFACDAAVVPLHKRFSVIRQTAIIFKDKTQFLLFHTRKKIILNLFFFVEYVNLDYIQWT